MAGFFVLESGLKKLANCCIIYLLKTKNHHLGLIIFSAIFLGAVLSISFAFAEYIPPPPSGHSYIPPPLPSAPIYAPPPISNNLNPASYPPPTGYNQTPEDFRPPVPPTLPVPDYLKDFNLDLDLNDFAERNQFPTENCFFPVKGRKKDFVEFIPDNMGGTFNFPTGTCYLEDQKCYISERKGRLPRMRKTDPPIYAGILNDSKYNNFPVIPYKYTDDIDFSKCMPTWTGYLEEKLGEISLYEPPKRDYSNQSCYHPLRAFTVNPAEQKSVFCNEEKCQFTESQYCDNKTGQCYKNGYPLKTKKGQPVITYKNYWAVNWDFCTDKNGTLIPEDGGIPFEERFQPGCSYRITAPNYHEKQYAGNIDFLIKCDENRCSFPGLDFDIKKKAYYRMIDDKMVYTNTPELGEFLTIDWTCLDANRVSDFNKKLLCRLISSDEKNPDCNLCYENKKFKYKGCGVPYDELGRRADIPEYLRDYILSKEVQLISPIISDLENNGEITWQTAGWFSGLITAMDIFKNQIDEPNRHRLAFIMSKFSNSNNHNEAGVEKLKKQIEALFPESVKKFMADKIKEAKERQCILCNTSSAESRLQFGPIRDACYACNE